MRPAVRVPAAVRIVQRTKRRNESVTRRKHRPIMRSNRRTNGGSDRIRWLLVRSSHALRTDASLALGVPGSVGVCSSYTNVV